MAELGNRDLSGRVIEAAITVNSALGPGFLESGYENALAVEPTARGIRLGQQRTAGLMHREVEAGKHRLDLLIEGVLLVEMKAAGIEEGLISNFASMPVTIKRVGPGRFVS